MNARAVLVPVLVLAAAAGVWYAARETGHSVPAATWRTGTGSDVKQGRNYDELPPETPVRLSFRADEPCHVYVFSHSDTDGTLLLFPSPGVKSDLQQPLPAGHSVLPGSYEGKELAWTTRTEVLPTTTYVVVAAKAPVPELDALLPKLRRWTNTALTARTMAVTAPGEGIELAAGPKSPLPDPLLQRAAALSANETIVNGPLAPDSVRADTWLGSWRIKEKPAK